MHVSEIAHQYITDPNEVLKLNDKVQVKVLEVDIARKRIALSIKQTHEAPVRRPQNGNPKFQNTNSRFQLKKQEDNLSDLNVNDALAALKMKFKK